MRDVTKAMRQCGVPDQLAALDSKVDCRRFSHRHACQCNARSLGARLPAWTTLSDALRSRYSRRCETGAASQRVQQPAIQLKCSHVYTSMGIELPRGILLHGKSGSSHDVIIRISRIRAPGVGKTALAEAIAAQASIPLHRVPIHSIVSSEACALPLNPGS